MWEVGFGKLKPLKYETAYWDAMSEPRRCYRDWKMARNEEGELIDRGRVLYLYVMGRSRSGENDQCRVSETGVVFARVYVARSFTVCPDSRFVIFRDQWGIFHPKIRLAQEFKYFWRYVYSAARLIFAAY